MELSLEYGPNPDTIFPLEGNRNVQFIRNTITRPNIVAGDYSYYDAQDGEIFEDRVLHHYEFLGDRLLIGKFCQFARDLTFIMNGANHKSDGISSFPFNIFGGGWEKHTPALDELPLKGDTVIGNDVWIGTEAMVMPGVTIGDGAIVAARAMVTKDVRPYSIVGGNPARELRRRFTDEIIEELLGIRWWDWDIEKISANIGIIIRADVDALRAASRSD